MNPYTQINKTNRFNQINRIYFSDHAQQRGDLDKTDMQKINTTLKQQTKALYWDLHHNNYHLLLTNGDAIAIDIDTDDTNPDQKFAIGVTYIENMDTHRYQNPRFKQLDPQ